MALDYAYRRCRMASVYLLQCLYKSRLAIECWIIASPMQNLNVAHSSFWLTNKAVAYKLYRQSVLTMLMLWIDYPASHSARLLRPLMIYALIWLSDFWRPSDISCWHGTYNNTCLWLIFSWCVFMWVLGFVPSRAARRCQGRSRW